MMRVSCPLSAMAIMLLGASVRSFMPQTPCSHSGYAEPDGAPENSPPHALMSLCAALLFFGVPAFGPCYCPPPPPGDSTELFPGSMHPHDRFCRTQPLRSMSSPNCGWRHSFMWFAARSSKTATGRRSYCRGRSRGMCPCWVVVVVVVVVREMYGLPQLRVR